MTRPMALAEAQRNWTAHPDDLWDDPLVTKPEGIGARR